MARTHDRAPYSIRARGAELRGARGNAAFRQVNSSHQRVPVRSIRGSKGTASNQCGYVIALHEPGQRFIVTADVQDVRVPSIRARNGDGGLGFIQRDKDTPSPIGGVAGFYGCRPATVHLDAERAPTSRWIQSRHEVRSYDRLQGRAGDGVADAQRLATVGTASDPMVKVLDLLCRPAAEVREADSQDSGKQGRLVASH